MGCKLRPLLIASNPKLTKINWLPSAKLGHSEQLRPRDISPNRGHISGNKLHH